MDLGLYTGDIAVAVPNMAVPPRLYWTGAPIDRTTFRTALAFLKWTHDRHQVEGQARFFYNVDTHKWLPVVLPQYIWSAGHTREVEENNETKEAILEKLFTAGYGEAGTIHHHSGMGAFQSGGDKTDELSRHGFHVTVGHMHGDLADFHARATFKKINYEQEKNMMIVAQWLPGLRTRTIGGKYIQFNPMVNQYWLSLKDLPDFPEEWKDLLVPKPETSVVTIHHGNRTTYTRQPSCSDRIKAKHKGEPPVYIDKLYVVWLRDPKDKLVIRARLPDSEKARAIAKKEEVKLIEPAKETKAEKKEAPEDIVWTTTEMRAMRNMTNEQFEIYLAGLQAAGAIVSDLDDAEDQLISAISRDLMEFRDTVIPDGINARDLEELCGELQSMSARMIRYISTSTMYKRGVTMPDDTEYMQMIALWLSMFSKTMSEVSTEEWTAAAEVCKTASAVNAKYDFYDLMCKALDEAMALGLVDEVYDKKGVTIVNPDHGFGFGTD
jgi:hypothetical protein